MPPHMALTLVDPPPGVSSQTRTIVVSTYRLGRGEDEDVKVDWVLADSSRNISRLHCVLTCVGDDWCITDVSSNGTFLNDEPQRLASDTTYRLMDGDHLRIGHYGFQVQIPGPSWASEPNREIWETVSTQSWSTAIDREVSASAGRSVQNPMAQNPEVQNPEAHEVAASVPADHRLLDRLLEGAGLSHLSVADPSAAMLRVGQAMRAVIAGLRRRQAEPRKPDMRNLIDTAGSDEDALAALIGASEPGRAMREALSDFGYDRPATMAAMRHAVADLLNGLSPDVLQQQAERSSPMMSPLDMQRKARAWDAFETRYAQLRSGLRDDFERVLGEAFATAYEQLMQSRGDGFWRPTGRPTGGKDRG
jgi:predicted component of type VI protein secretion system